MQTVTIDLIPKDEKPVVKVSQVDDHLGITFLVQENGEDINLSPGDTITCIIRKPDNNIVTIEGILGYPQNKVIVYLTEQACACHGLAWGELVIDSGTARQGSCNFILDVEISPEFGGIDSTSVIDNLSRQIAQIVGVEVAEIAPEIIAEIAPTIIGSNYLTKDQMAELYYNKVQIQTDYYTKTQADTEISKAKPKAIIQTLEAGDTVITFTTSLSAAALVEFKINEPGINEPTIVESTIGDNRIFTLTFDAAFEHDVSIMLLNVLYEV